MWTNEARIAAATLAILFTTSSCASGQRMNAAREKNVCDMVYSPEKQEEVSFRATYITDGMSHTFFKCSGGSTIDAAHRAADSDGSFEAFLLAREQECHNQKIDPCSVEVEIEGLGRLVTTKWGVALEVVSLRKPYVQH